MSLQARFRSRALDRVSGALHVLFTDESFILGVPSVPWVVDPRAGSVLLCLVALSELSNAVLKWIAQRPRPFWTNPRVASVGGMWEQDYSWPSSHSQLTTSLVGILAAGLSPSPGAVAFAVALALCTGLSRVYRGVHTASDVIAGWFVGVVFGVAVHWWNPAKWFEDLSHAQQWLLFAASCVVPVATLLFVRRVVQPPPAAVVAKWQEMALRNSGHKAGTRELLLEPRRLAKYTLQLASLPGGLLGAIVSLRLLERFELRFLREACHEVLLGRLLLGYAGLVVLFALFFAVPSVFPNTLGPTRPWRHAYRTVIAFAIGFWTLCGCPLTAQRLLGAECPIFNPAIAGARYQLNTTAIDADPTGHIGSTGLWPCHITPPFSAVHEIDAYDVCSVRHLQRVVRQAIEGGYKVRVLGNGHSMQPEMVARMPKWPNASVAASDTCVEPEEDADLPWGERGNTYMISLRFLASLHVNADGTATVGAGINLGSTGRDRDPMPPLLPQLWELGYSLPNMPGITNLTLGGVLSTGSDGDSHRYSLYDAVLGFKLVDGEGNVRVAKGTSDATPEERRLFYGGLISLGLVGVVFEYTLQLEPRFCTEDMEPQWLENVRNLTAEIVPRLDSQDYNRIFVSLFSEWKTPTVAVGAVRRVRSAFDAETCDGDPDAHKVYEIMKPQHFRCQALLTQRIFHPTCFTYPSMRSQYAFGAHTQRLLSDSSRDRKDRVAVEWCLHTVLSDPRPAPTILAEGPTREQLQACLGRAYDVQRAAPSGQRKPIHLMVPREDGVLLAGSLSLLFFEVYIPHSVAPPSRVVQLMAEFIETRGWNASRELAAFEFFQQKQLPFWMAPSYDGPVTRVGQFLWLSDDTHPDEFFSQFREHLHANGVSFRTHWGKRQMHRAEELARLKRSLPKLRDFQALVKEHDPQGVFLSPEWEFLMQEVV